MNGEQKAWTIAGIWFFTMVVCVLCNIAIAAGALAAASLATIIVGTL